MQNSIRNNDVVKKVRRVNRGLAILAGAMVLMTAALSATGQQAVAPSSGSSIVVDGNLDAGGKLRVGLNKTTVVNTRARVARVSIGSPEIADVNVISPTNVLTLSSILPLLQNPNQKVAGCVIVSQPMDTEFLTGVVTKFALDSDHLTGVDLCLISTRENKLVAITPNLLNDRSPEMRAFIADLEKRGVVAAAQPPTFDPNIAKFLHLPPGGFEKGQRWWNQINIVDSGPDDKEAKLEKTLVALLLLSTPVPEFGARLAVVLLLAGTCGAVALLFALLFTAGISKGVNEPLNLLIDRTNELATQQTTPPPLEGLSGDWLELGELIDTALSSMRGSVQSLRTQLSKQQEEGQENSKAVEDKVQQLENLNRQFSHQAKQLTEVSKQINNANRQSVMLQHKLDSVLQVSTEGFLILDQFGNILSANPVFLNWVGCNEGEIAGGGR